MDYIWYENDRGGVLISSLSNTRMILELKNKEECIYLEHMMNSSIVIKIGKFLNYLMQYG